MAGKGHVRDKKSPSARLSSDGGGGGRQSEGRAAERIGDRGRASEGQATERVGTERVGGGRKRASEGLSSDGGEMLYATSR